MTKIFDISRCKVGQFNYGRHYKGWGVWKCVYNDGKRASGEFIKDFINFEDAKAFVYQMNGWKVA